MNIDTSVELRKFVSPEMITGLNARLLVGRYIEHFKSKKPMIVTDKIISTQNWYNDIINEIKKYVDDYIVFDKISSNPRDREAMQGAELFLSYGCDLLIAVGGGSPMDCAKCISIVSTNGGYILDYEGVDEINLPGPPLICIPSTAGTSADVSQFSIILDTENFIKKTIISKKIVPDLALIDPIPLETMDSYLMACTGMDALTHAIEAYVSNAQSSLTDIHALAAIKLISGNIENTVLRDKSVENMYNIMIGSLQAGLAFSNASLGAIHAMAHSLGGLLDLPHGECNSILLEHVMDANFESSPERFIAIGEQMGLQVDINDGDKSKNKILDRIREIRENLGIKSYVYIDSISEEILDKLTENAFNDPCMITNPKELSISEVKSIYERILRKKE